MAVSGGTKPSRGIPDGSLGLAKLADLAPGTVIGQPIDGSTSVPKALSPTELGEAMRLNSVRSISLSVGGGGGAGGEYIDTDPEMQMPAETTHVLMTVSGTGTIEISGTASENLSGHVLVWSINAGSHNTANVRFLHLDSQTLTATHRYVMTSELGSAAETTLVNRYDVLVTNHFAGNWRVRSQVVYPFMNTQRENENEVIMFRDGRFQPVILTPNDLDWPKLLVQSESDLPAAISGVITVPANTVVQVRGQVSLTAGNRIVFGDNCVLMGYGREQDRLIFDVADWAITLGLTPGSFDMHDIAIEQDNVSGDGFRTLDTTAVRINIARTRITMNGAGDAMTLAAGSLNMNLCSLEGFENGLTLTAGGGVISFNEVGMTQAVGGAGNTCLDLGAGTNDWQLISCVNMLLLSQSGGIGFQGAASNGNLNGTGTGRLDKVTFVGAGTHLSGVTADDLQWIIQDCSGITNSEFSGSYSMNANATQTTIADGTFTVIAGTTTEGVVHRMSMTDNNEMTITRLLSATYVIHVQASVFKSGTNTSYSIGVFVNGSQVGPSMSAEINTISKTIPLSVLTTLAENDVVRIRIRNNDNTNDVTVEALSVNIIGTK